MCISREMPGNLSEWTDGQKNGQGWSGGPTVPRTGRKMIFRASGEGAGMKRGPCSTKTIKPLIAKTALNISYHYFHQ